MGRIKWAIIGLGYIGRRHAQLIAENPRCELVAVVDPNPDIDLTGIPTSTEVLRMDGARSMHYLKALEVELIGICTPNYLHYPHAVRCIYELGADVVIEKPMALEGVQAFRLIEDANKAGVRIFPVLQNRYSPAAAWLHSAVQAGELGEIRQIHISCLWNRDGRYYGRRDNPHPWHGDIIKDGGVLYTQFSHFVDLLVWIFGVPTVWHAELSHCAEFSPLADTGAIIFRVGTALGSMAFTTTVPGSNYESSLTVIGSKGVVKLGGQYMERVDACTVPALSMPDAPPPKANKYAGYEGSANNHYRIIDNVVGVLLDGAEPDICATDAAHGVAFIDDVYRAAKRMKITPAKAV